MTDKWFTRTPKPVYEQNDVTVGWNLAVHTDGEFTLHRPEIIIKNKTQKTCKPTDLAISADGNEAEKKLNTRGYRKR